MADPVEAFAYLWATERDDWVVLRPDPEEAGLPYNRAGRGVLLIEDDELSDAVVQRMDDRGGAFGRYDGLRVATVAWASVR